LNVYAALSLAGNVGTTKRGFCVPLTREQLEQRRQSIGGSDIAAIAGMSPHRSAFQLYLEKIGEVDLDDEQPTDNQIWGDLLEEPVAQFYAKKHSVLIDSLTEPLVHPDYDFLTANPDRVVMGLERLIEIKTTGLGGIDIWRDPEKPTSLRPPRHVVLQVNWYLGFLGWKEADLVLLQFCEGFSNPDRYVEFEIAFDEELFELEMQLAINFWHNHVLERVTPESEDAEEVSEYLKHTYRSATDKMLTGGDEESEIAARLAHANKQFKHWKEQKAIEGNSLKAIIGENAGIKGEGWVYTWRFTKSGGTDWKGLALSKNPTQAEIDAFVKQGYRRPYFKYRGETGD
jgi:putative phage-type endonuclease